MKAIILSIWIVIFTGCNTLNEQDRYVKQLKVGNILDVTQLEDAEIKLSNEKITKYYYRLWYSAFTYTEYYITTGTDNKIIAIWSYSNH